ncbi:replication factor-a protein [Rhizopus microsporus var. microsporus]|uniref:Replication protein A subunit n=1 Tax=Rhizopus microsporus var. microsporus TaxID=86635 RepID=A0A1X0RD39_RHIZD|nr:replication factor-a protein [Rhizopus microsporus var. microsporus]
MSQQLSVGAIKAIHFEENSNPLATNPVVQIINIKALPVNGATRYRAIVSDGVNFMQAMLSTQHTGLVEQGQIKRNSIVRIKEYACNMLSNKKVLIILNLEVVISDVDAKVGTPVSLDPTSASPSAANTQSRPQSQLQPQQQQQQQQQPLFNNTSTSYSSASPTFNSPGNFNTRPNMQLESSLTPIKNINPYQSRWTIKARVTQKSQIKQWHNNRGDGKLFSLNLLDQSGEIKATAFNDQVDRLYHMLEEGKVYYLSKARVTMARKQFSTLDNEYELTLEAGTEIELCSGDSAIPQMNFKFVKVSDLDNIEAGSTIDIMGVVIQDNGVTEIVTKSTGRPTKKRELSIVDESGKSVRLTIWDKTAEEFDSNDSPIIACRGVRVSDFNGRSLSLSASGTLKTNPDIPETQRLRQWFNSNGNKDFGTFSNSGAMGENMSRPTNKVNLLQVRTEDLGSGIRPDYFSFKGTVAYIKQEMLAYPGCPECRKKLLQEENGWRCEKCQKTFTTPEWKFILTIGVNDPTSQLFFNTFDDVGRALLGISANELMEIKDNDISQFQKICGRALFKSYHFKARAKSETYNVSL